MKDFNYHLPNDLSGAASIVKGSGDGKFMAGGMTLIPVLKQRLAAHEDIVDLGAIAELKGVKVEGGELVVGAMTCHADVNASADVKNTIPALSELAGQIADPAVRHRGTIGGSISNADPAADYPAAVLGLNATVVTTDRQIAADDFFTGFFSTALEPGEIVKAVRFKKPDKAKYVKLRHPASGYAVVGVMVARYGKDVRVAITGAAPSVFRATEMEKALAANFSVDAIKDIVISADGLMEDIHSGADYRAHVATVFVRRAVAAIA
ncbi:MAG: hypothetical protein RLZ98_2579 [Pseudomonadota bacterium]|jgi:carbon-monoxide dehydrogenase medium subunit